jgi:hypothetical protein
MNCNDDRCCCGEGPQPEPASPERRDFLQRAALLAGSVGVLGGVGIADAVGADDAAPDDQPADLAQADRAMQQARATKYASPVDRPYNGIYAGANLNRVAFPIGGIGAGMFCVEGTGAISHMSVRNRMEFFHEPGSFAAVCVKRGGAQPNIARVLEGPVPDWKYFGAEGSGNGSAGASHGFPRFQNAAFAARCPFATVELKDDALPLDVSLTAWSPFTPGDADSSSMPVGVMEYTFANPSAAPVEAVFSFHTKNFMKGELEDDFRSRDGHGIAAFPGGFQLWSDDTPRTAGTFAFFVDSADVVVDHCWFRGGWWDAPTLAWRNVQNGTLLDNPPIDSGAPGASLFVPFTVAPGQKRTIRLMTAWYAGNTNLRIGMDNRTSDVEDASIQQPSGSLGKRMINSSDPFGDGLIGGLISRQCPIEKRYIHFLISGSSQEEKTVLRLVVDGEVREVTGGDGGDRLEWRSWDVTDLRKQSALIQIIDFSSAPGGRICVDSIVFSDLPIGELKEPDGNALKTSELVTVFEDFESPTAENFFGSTVYSDDPDQKSHRPWYTSRFENVGDVASSWKQSFRDLRRRSALFRDTFYDTTLPPEVVEAVAANLTILKSPTVMRQADGRLWCWEGCRDDEGCCHGSCTHVWNYAQALAHLFPDLERSLRETEYNEGLFPDGKQAFRINLPISPGGLQISASDGQLGGILKMYREWRISGDTGWLRDHWTRMRQALDFMIATWDPRETGLPEESHHNTYDISYFGPDGHCGTFYVAALEAAVKMGDVLDDDTSRYRMLRDRGVERLESELFNGEYFIQRIMADELSHSPPKIGDFKSFLSTATGFGSVELKDGDVSVTVVSGSIDVRRTVVADG